LASTADIALHRADLVDQIENSMVEAGLLRTIATHILAARSVDEALAAVTNEALNLLSSDIAGVMLGDGDEIVMRGCAGNQRVETARLRMRRGQGLAGLVLATGRPERVDDYVASIAISNDFHPLAHEERISCAMGVPIRVGDDIIGVLEVWRRAADAYTDVECARLVTLADLAAVAFDNALMHEANATSLVEIEKAHTALAQQYATNDLALRLQQELLEALLDDPQLVDLLQVIARVSDSRVHMFDADLEHLASYPGHSNAAAVCARLTAGTRNHPKRSPHHISWTSVDGCSIAFQDITIGGDLVGWLCLETDAEPHDPNVSTALTHASLACALRHLQEQAGARARAQQREDILLELLDGSVDVRRAAMSRAKHVHIDLRGSMRVVIVTAKDIATDRRTVTDLHRVQRCVSDVLLDHQISRGLTVMRDDALIFVTRSPDPDQLKAALHEASRTITQPPRLAWGVSSECHHALDLDAARVQAETALRMSASSPRLDLTFFDDLGIIGLFLSGSADEHLERFVVDTLGAVRQYDETHGSTLMHTLQTYLDCNCSQTATAERLFVHPKTVKYRLTTVERLSGLTLSTHHDRLLADIAVRAAHLA
jgi:sugar diacid utilization regulator/putative methionine-R-sulfoxide reductase with GAF domain